MGRVDAGLRRGLIKIFGVHMVLLLGRGWDQAIVWGDVAV